MVLVLCVQEHARAKMKVLVLVLVLGAAGVAATAAPLGDDDDDAPQTLVMSRIALAGVHCPPGTYLCLLLSHQYARTRSALPLQLATLPPRMLLLCILLLAQHQ